MKLSAFLILLLAFSIAAGQQSPADYKAQLEDMRAALQTAIEQRNAAQDQVVNMSVLLNQLRRKLEEVKPKAEAEPK